MFSVVILNYNGQEFLSGCLGSILAADGSLVTEIIVVDNGSSDGSVKTIRKFQISKPKFQTSSKSQISKIKLIENRRNLGFAKAANQGILAAKEDFVVLINNDLRLDKQWFLEAKKAIEKWHKKEPVAAYFGKVLNWQGTEIESTGLVYWLKGKSLNRGNGLSAKTDRYQKEEFVFGPSASVVVYYQPALVQAGLFDEDFFAYEEDVDLNLRLNNAGWKTLYSPKMIAYHLGGGTSRKMGNFRQRMDTKNWWFIIIKNYPVSILVKYGLSIFIERLRNLSGLIKATAWYRIPATLLATYGELLLKLPKLLKKRKPVRENILLALK
ncbi:MAG: glycosyltransferase family 2 protein [Patescibacteria group bacterium]|nr:glycosyltransferase family 2 protein [Patescibacteria group bacterium]